VPPVPQLDEADIVEFIGLPLTASSPDAALSDDSESGDSSDDAGGITTHRRTFRQILEQWSEKHNATRRELDDLLKMLHTDKPDLNYDDLPRSGKTVTRDLKAAREEMAKFPVRPMKTMKDSKWRRQLVPQSDDEPSSGSDDDGEFGAGDVRRTGQYVHLGLETCLLGTSPGLYHYADHIAMLRRAEAHSPGILPEHYLAIAFGKELETAKALHQSGIKLSSAYFWYNPSIKRPEVLLFSLNMHVDGVQVYDNAEKAEVMPILATIHELVPFNPSCEPRPDYSKGKFAQFPIHCVRAFVLYAGEYRDCDTFPAVSGMPFDHSTIFSCSGLHRLSGVVCRQMRLSIVPTFTGIPVIFYTLCPQHSSSPSS
jgi:hypothetical protein